MGNELLQVKHRAQGHEQAKCAFGHRLVGEPGDAASLGAEQRLEHHVAAQVGKGLHRRVDGLASRSSRGTRSPAAASRALARYLSTAASMERAGLTTILPAASRRAKQVHAETPPARASPAASCARARRRSRPGRSRRPVAPGHRAPSDDRQIAKRQRPITSCAAGRGPPQVLQVPTIGRSEYGELHRDSEGSGRESLRSLGACCRSSANSKRLVNHSRAQLDRSERYGRCRGSPASRPPG